MAKTIGTTKDFWKKHPEADPKKVKKEAPKKEASK